MKNTVIIIGGGIIGIAVARELCQYNDLLNIIVVEKENKLGMHSATRNSGVIHAGFYYDPDSIRGKFCADANKLLRNYCEKNTIPTNKCGKVVVAKNVEEELILSNLYQRGLANGSQLELLDSIELDKIEPFAQTHKKFLWSPNTWSASPGHVLTTLISECKERGVQFVRNFEVQNIDVNCITSKDSRSLQYDFLINAAGGYSLKLSRIAGLNTNYAILPFKGLYLKSKKKVNGFKRHIYPVPNPKQTFLGIHTTLTFDGFLKLGPTAIPVLSPENYKLFNRLTINDLLEVVPLHLSLFLSNSFGFRDLALQEVRNIMKSQIVKSANNLLKCKLSAVDFDWYSPGIRAQLFDKKNRSLVSDFIINETDNSLHLLNCISPAWTCSLKTAQFVAEKVLQKLT